MAVPPVVQPDWRSLGTGKSGMLAKEGLELAVKKGAKTEAKEGAELAVKRGAPAILKSGVGKGRDRAAVAGGGFTE